MTDDEKWLFVGETLEKLKSYADRHEAAFRAVMLPPESPLVEPFFYVHGLIVTSLERLVDDRYQSIDWFVSECDFGRSPKQAGCNGESRLIRNVDDLRWFVESSSDVA